MFRAVLVQLAGLAFVLPALSACGADPAQFEDLKSNIRNTDPNRRMCGQPPPPRDDSGAGGPTPAIPYPSPAGENVTPGITGIPLPPNSVQVDSFLARGTVVQVFETDTSANDVFDFYDDVMREHGWFAGAYASGFMCEYAADLHIYNVRPEHWVRITTAFIPREHEEPKPGEPLFGDPGLGYQPRSPDKTFFSIITPKP